jgi:NitT/TauT family transport system permease protein
METRTIGFGIAILAAIGLIWEIVVRTLNVASFLLPPPSAVLEEIFSRPEIYWSNFLVTLGGTVAGFLIAAVAGVFMGILLVYSKGLRAILYPIIVVLQTAPKIAIAPLLIVWLGYGLLPKLVMVVSVCFFPVVMSTVAGLSSVEKDLLDLVRMLRGGAVQQFVKVAFPQAMPFIFSGLKVAATLAVIGEIVAEFVSGNTGLGNVIVVANSELNIAMSFAALLLLCAMGLGLFGLMELLERVLVPWSVEDSEALFASP